MVVVGLWGLDQGCTGLQPPHWRPDYDVWSLLLSASPRADRYFRFTRHSRPWPLPSTLCPPRSATHSIPKLLLRLKDSNGERLAVIHYTNICPSILSVEELMLVAWNPSQSVDFWQLELIDITENHEVDDGYSLSFFLGFRLWFHPDMFKILRWF